MKWIDVNEQLPPVDETVILWSLDYEDCYGCYKYDNLFDIEEVGAVGDVTHWMPRPKPPFKPIINVEQSMKNLDKSIKKASKNWKGVNVDEFIDEVKGICPHPFDEQETTFGGGVLCSKCNKLISKPEK